MTGKVDNKVVRNTMMLYLMNIAKMIFPLLTLPYLTRILTVECYGVVSYVKAVMQYMQLIVDFGFVLSGTRDIVMARSDKERLGIEAGDVLAAKILLSIFAFGILCIAAIFIPILKSNIVYTLLSFLTVFLTNFLFDYLFRGLERMGVITVRFVIMKGMAAVLTFAFVKSDADIWWIPVLEIIGSCAAIMLVFCEIRKLGIHFRVESLSCVFIKIKDSAVYFFSNMATTAFMALNTLLIGIFIETGQVAYWSLCLQIVTAIQSLYTPLTDGIYPHMVKHRDIRILKKAMGIYMPVITAGCIFTYFSAEYALLLVGGTQYAEAAPVLRCLIPVLFFSFLSMLHGWPALGAIGRQKETTKTTVASAVLQVAGLFLLIIIGHFTLINIAILRGITEMLLFGMRFGYVMRYREEFAS